MRFTSQLTAAIVAAATFSFSVGTRAEMSSITVAQQYGLAYIQFYVMRRDKLIEKQLAKNGLPDVSVSWRKFAGSNVMYDAVFSGNLQIASGGLTPLLTVWDKTRSNFKAHGIAAMNTMPLLLNSRNPAVRSIADLTDKDKIALPSVKISMHAITLQIAAAKMFGDSAFDRFDPLTVSMSHPDAMLALLSGHSEINAHFTSPPYQYQELADPSVHTILDSSAVMGRSTTFTVLWTTSAFREQNPRIYKSVYDAFSEATRIVNADMRGAAELFVAVEKPKLSVDEVYAILTKPGITFTTVPSGVMQYAQFMHAHGLIKEMPSSWKDVFFDDIADLPGN
jgi:NitT/TauT family transport system substrate-binding protein